MPVKEVNGYPFVEYKRPQLSESDMIAKAKEFFSWIDERRSVRDFSDLPIPQEVIENIIQSASTAPSGANKQPWMFCIVTDQKIKQAIRVAAEKEEQENYNGRMNEEWIEALKPLQTDWRKEFLETAPVLIIVFKKAYDLLPDGKKSNNYYVNESVGIACGFLLAAIHKAGLVALTHTPSPMNFLTAILKRPENERPFLLIPVGYPASDAFVPELRRKNLSEVAVYY